MTRQPEKPARIKRFESMLELFVDVALDLASEKFEANVPSDVVTLADKEDIEFIESWYAAYKRDKQKAMAKMRKTALAKLTKEERSVLGIE